MATILNENDAIIEQIRDIYCNATPSLLRNLIEKHFIPSQEEKQKNAEIPTPVKLVDEMLEKVPEEFWKTPHKVLEPCCGKGNFVLGIFDKFYKGLAELYEDEIERCRVIITECLYYADITELNVFITTEILKCHVQSYCGLEYEEWGFEFNSNVGNTLELDIKKKWCMEGFDAVIGNPPYNSSGNTGTGNTIWQDFTKISLEKWILKEGLLVMVHPPGWRKPNTDKGKYYKLYEIMCIKNQMVYLEIHNTKDGLKVFGCGTRYDWYVIEKKGNYIKTIVIDENGLKQKINLKEYKWLPNSNILEIKKILAFNDNERCPIIYDRTSYGSDNKKHISKIKNEEYKYECIHTIPLSGIRYIYSKVNDKGHFGIKKVIFGDNGLNDVIIDITGKYGMSENSMAIQIENIEEGEQLKKALLSKKFKNIIKSCIMGNFRIDWRLFKEFKKDFWKEFL